MLALYSQLTMQNQFNISLFLNVIPAFCLNMIFGYNTEVHVAIAMVSNATSLSMVYKNMTSTTFEAIMLTIMQQQLISGCICSSEIICSWCHCCLSGSMRLKQKAFIGKIHFHVLLCFITYDWIFGRPTIYVHTSLIIRTT